MIKCTIIKVEIAVFVTNNNGRQQNMNACKLQCNLRSYICMSIKILIVVSHIDH